MLQGSRCNCRWSHHVSRIRVLLVGRSEWVDVCCVARIPDDGRDSGLDMAQPVEESEEGGADGVGIGSVAGRKVGQARVPSSRGCGNRYEASAWYHHNHGRRAIRRDGDGLI